MRLLVLASSLLLFIDGLLCSSSELTSGGDGVGNSDTNVSKADTTEGTGERNPDEIGGGTASSIGSNTMTSPELLTQDKTIDSSEALMSLKRLRQDITATLASIDDGLPTGTDGDADKQIQEALTSSPALNKLKMIRQNLSAKPIDATPDNEDDEQSMGKTTRLVSQDEGSGSVSQNPRKQTDDSPKGLPLIRSKSLILPQGTRTSPLHNSDEEVSAPPKKSTPPLKPCETFKRFPSELDLDGGPVPSGKPLGALAKTRIIRVPSKWNDKEVPEGGKPEQTSTSTTIPTVYKPIIDPSLFKEASKQDQRHYIKRNVVAKNDTTARHRSNVRVDTGHKASGKQTEGEDGEKENGFSKPRKRQTSTTPQSPLSTVGPNPPPFTEMVPYDTTTTSTLNTETRSLRNERSRKSSSDDSSNSSSSSSDSGIPEFNFSLFARTKAVDHQSSSSLGNPPTQQPPIHPEIVQGGSLTPQQTSINTIPLQEEHSLVSSQHSRTTATTTSNRGAQIPPPTYGALHQGPPPNSPIGRQRQRSSCWSDCLWSLCAWSRERGDRRDV